MRHDIAPSLLFSLMVSINPAKSIGGDQGATLLGVPASEHLKRENLEQEQDQKGGATHRLPRFLNQFRSGRVGTSIAQRKPTWLLPVSGEVPRRAEGR